MLALVPGSHGEEGGPVEAGEACPQVNSGSLEQDGAELRDGGQAVSEGLQTCPGNPHGLWSPQ